MLALASICMIVLGFGKDGKGVIITDSDLITLSTLTTNTVLKQTAPLQFTDRFRLIKLEAMATAVGATAGEGPILIGIASNSLTAAEIASAISANGPLSKQAGAEHNNAEFPVWTLGLFRNLAGTLQLVEGTGMEPGRMEKTIRWTFGVDSSPGYTWWAQNRSGSNMTTGMVITIESKMFGVWTD